MNGLVVSGDGEIHAIMCQAWGDGDDNRRCPPWRGVGGGSKLRRGEF